MTKFMKKNSNAITATWILISLAGCSTTPEVNEPSPVPEEKVVTKRTSLMERQIISSIGFAPGQRAVNRKGEIEIKKAIEAAKAKGDIVMVEMVVWSDQKSPKSGDILSPKQKKLAVERVKNLKALIDLGVPDASVIVINMADRPSPLSRHFDTTDEYMKTKLTSMGFAPGPNNSFESGKPSTALLLIKVK